MQATRLFDLLINQLEKFPKPDALCSKINGQWVKYSTQQFKEYADNFSYGLLASGLNKGDKIGIIANNRPEWNFVDMGSLQAGIIDVPVYPTISETDLKYILNHAEVKIVFVSTAELYQKVNSIAKEIPCIKGVMLSHSNILKNCEATETLCPFDKSWRALSFLPLNHVYERMLSYLYMYYGISVYYAESMETIADNLKEVKPMIFVTVPRLLEKVYDKIVSKGNELTGIKKSLFFWALNLGLRYELNEANGWWYELQLKIANKIIFSKWREALGGNVCAIASGGAALQPRLARVFWSAKIPVLEGYGLTETSPVIAVNNFQPGCVKFGTVGTVLSNVQVKFADDGEILCKGPNVMLGYYNEPELTAEVLDKDDWFHTGDIGKFVDDKYLKITDRKKEIFKTSGGKYIAPQMIENKLKESPFIEQAIIIGENEKFAAALIVPAFAFIKDWAVKKGYSFNANQEIASSKDVRDRIREEIEGVNKTLGQYESIKKFELLACEFSIEKGEMTPKLSLKRKMILQNNKEFVKKIYGE